MKFKSLFLLWLLLPYFMLGCSKDESVNDLPEGADTEDAWNENYHFKLPVVFHLLYASESNPQQNPSQEHINKVLKGLNQVYANCGVDLNLEFVLAEKDPDNNVLAEPGIDRVQWTSASIFYQAFMNGTEQRYLDVIWDPNKYINIVLYTFKDSESSTVPSRTQGISTFPYTVVPAQLDGCEMLEEVILPEDLKHAHCISINNACIDALRDDYTKFDESNYDAQDVVVTLAHEIGHYLGLYHAFSSDDSCEDTDYCTDTPVYNRTKYNELLSQYPSWEEYSKHFHELVWRTDCFGEKFKSDNIMDYAVSYRNRFTEEQRKRIRYILDNAILMPGPKRPAVETVKRKSLDHIKEISVPVRFSE